MKDSIIILCGGGPAPGMNTVVMSVAKTFLNGGYRVIGLHGGYSGLFSPKPRIDSVCQAPDFTRNRIALSEPFEIHGAALTVRHGDESAVLELPDGGMLEVALTRQTAADGAQRVRARLAEPPPAPPPKRARLALNTHGMGGKSAPLATVRSATLYLCK